MAKQPPLPPCGWQDPDSDEPENDLWESASPFGYGHWEHRTFWSVTRPGREWDDEDWFQWDVEWSGTHWLWVGNMDPQDLQILTLVYRATGDARDPLQLLVWGQAYGHSTLEVRLEVGQIYYVKVVNMAFGQVGCYDLWLDP